MVTNSRIRFDIYFTVNSRQQVRLVCQQLGNHLSKRFGGVTFLNDSQGSTGYWTADSHLFLDEFPSEVIREPLVVFTLSVLPDQKESALTHIQKELQNIKDYFATNSHYVHIESQVVEAHHFKLD